MTDLYKKNYTESTAELYFGITTGTVGVDRKPSTVFKTGIIDVEGVPGRHVQIGADNPNNAYVDFKSMDGNTTDYDSRIISLNGATGIDGKGQLVMQAGIVEAWAPMRIGSSVAPAFRLDYGFQLFGVTENPQATVLFTPNVFTNTVAPPSVFLTTQTYQPNVNQQQATIEGAPSITSFVIQYWGTPPGPEGARVNWMAIGL